MLVFAALVALAVLTVWAARILKLVAIGMSRVAEQERYDREFHRMVQRLGALDPEGD